MLQAMASKLTIIGSEIGGIVDHIEHRKNGFLFPAGDVETLAKDIIELITNPELRNYLGENAQNYINKNLAWSKLAIDINNTYHKILNDKNFEKNYRVTTEYIMESKDKLVNHYNVNMPFMENADWFYDWIIGLFENYQFDKLKQICDVGCGTGYLINKLYSLGYLNVSGSDFADSAIAFSKKRTPKATFFQHDITEDILPLKFDLIICTGVLDFLSSPENGLDNMKNSLKPNGRLFISIRNKNAYWPFYHLRNLSKLIRSDRWRNWFLWFTTPLGLRRRDQPLEKVFNIAEVKRMLKSANIQIIEETGFQIAPMFWINDIPIFYRFAKFLDIFCSLPILKSRCYYYCFVCSND